MTDDHVRRTQLLRDLAVLSGFRTTVECLPDGSVPDVFQLNPNLGSAFLGDAKATETARTSETYLRLRGYLRWCRAAASAAHETSFALAVGQEDLASWLATTQELVRDVGVDLRVVDSTRFGRDGVILATCA